MSPGLLGIFDYGKKLTNEDYPAGTRYDYVPKTGEWIERGAFWDSIVTNKTIKDILDREREKRIKDKKKNDPDC